MRHAGRLPFWLAPRQVVVAAIVSDADEYVHEVVAALTAAGVRAEADIRNEKINYKVRERSVSVRRLGEKSTSVVPLDEIIASLALEATPPDLV